MKHLTRSTFTVETQKPLVGLTEIKGVQNISQKGNSWEFQVDSEKLPEVISHISQFGVLKLESSAPTLEDLFMRHYKEKSF